MNKRTFLKTSGALMKGAVLANLEACAPEKRPLKNWAGNLEYGTGNVLYPKSVAEVQEMVKNSKKLRGLGSRHSFNKIADSTSCQVSSEGLNQIIELNRTARTVTVEAGMKYGDLCTYLHESGFALHNLASLPHISIAGSIATATHGSGVTNGNLATSVAAIEFVTGAGEVVELTKDDDAFQGAVVGLGALGMVTKVTLNLLPTFEMQQVVYRNLAMSELEKNFLAIMSAGYSVSLFTDWKNKNVSEVWIKDLVKAEARPNDFYGAKLATQNLHPIESLSAETCTEQLGVPGPWYDRMPHFKMGFKPSAGAELQSEYFVPLEHGYEAMKTIEELSEKISPHLFISEIRSVAADNLWMSPCYGKACIAIHTTWKQEWDAVMGLLPLFEEKLAPFNARPHWGKLFTLTPSVLQGRIEKLNDFKELMLQHDPEGKFRNEFIDRNLF